VLTTCARDIIARLYVAASGRDREVRGHSLRHTIHDYGDLCDHIFVIIVNAYLTHR
jgi:hypothetical protein